MQITSRLEKLEQIANLPRKDEPEECPCQEAVYYPYDLYIKCSNPHPSHPTPCYRDWIFERLVNEQRTVVKGKCVACEVDLGYLWDLTNTPEPTRQFVMESDPHGWDDIHFRYGLIRSGLFDFVDWPQAGMVQRGTHSGRES